MSLLLSSITIVDPQSPFNGSVKDILIENRMISSIEDKIDSSESIERINGEGLSISPSWVDIGCYSGEPGNEHRETFHSLREAAHRGGYGHLAILPDTDPVIENSSMVRSILSQNEDEIIQLWPLAAISHQLQGKELTEMLDLSDAGAIGFMDAQHPLRSDAFMLKVLEYSKKMSRPVFHQPHNPELVKGAMVHESKLSTSMGLKAWPVISETILMDRDLELLKYVESGLCWHQLSSAGAVERMKWAKNAGLDIKAGVNYLHLCYTEDALSDFNSDFKLSPPLREEEDRQALWEGLLEDNIHYIISGHRPWEEERKKLEFPYAAFGAEGLESAFSTFLQNAPSDRGLELWVQKTAIAPREILGLPSVIVDKGLAADFTLYDAKEEFTFQKENIFSLSSNNPNVGKNQKGKIKGRIFRDRYVPCERNHKS